MLTQSEPRMLAACWISSRSASLKLSWTQHRSAGRAHWHPQGLGPFATDTHHHRSHYTESITYTAWHRAEKLTVSQLVKKFPAFYGTQKFITVHTRVRPWSLYRVSLIKSINTRPIHLRFIKLMLFLSLTKYSAMKMCPCAELSTTLWRPVGEWMYSSTHS
jgi:hypothetical protein